MADSVLSEGYIEELHDALLDSRLKPRRDGVKRLSTWLESDDFTRILDRNTLHLNHTGGKITKATWPAFCVTFLNLVNSEVNSNKSKIDQNLCKTFRKLVEAAEATRRSGERLMLVRKARSIFTKVHAILHEVTLNSTIGLDLASALRNHLLVVPEYCSQMNLETAQGLMDQLMQHLEAAPEFGGRGSARHDEVFRAASMLELLVRQCAGARTPRTGWRLLEGTVVGGKGGGGFPLTGGGMTQ